MPTTIGDPALLSHLHRGTNIAAPCTPCLTTIQAAPIFCYDCGAAVPPDCLLCPECGACSFSETETRPRAGVQTPKHADLPWPWTVLHGWPSGFLVSLSGGPGSGKSSLAAVLDPSVWLTSEQTPKQVRVMFDRVAPAGRPLICPVSSPAQVADAIDQVAEGLIVLDSLTHCGTWTEQLEILEYLAEWTRARSGRRSLPILQVNAAGDAAGLTAVPHLVDACADLYSDTVGLRRIGTWKNRGGPLDCRYFVVDKDGLNRPPFDRYAWSVEGDPGRYILHAWPLPKARWADVLTGLFERVTESEGGSVAVTVAEPGVAGAGVRVTGYDAGILEPADIADRRRFAEAHGLRWINPTPQP